MTTKTLWDLLNADIPRDFGAELAAADRDFQESWAAAYYEGGYAAWACLAADIAWLTALQIEHDRRRAGLKGAGA